MWRSSSDIIEEEFSTLDKLTDDTEAEIFDAIAENDRCNKIHWFRCNWYY